VTTVVAAGVLLVLKIPQRLWHWLRHPPILPPAPSATQNPSITQNVTQNPNITQNVTLEARGRTDLRADSELETYDEFMRLISEIESLGRRLVNLPLNADGDREAAAPATALWERVNEIDRLWARQEHVCDRDVLDAMNVVVQQAMFLHEHKTSLFARQQPQIRERITQTWLDAIEAIARARQAIGSRTRRLRHQP
jgi:hypothetical protein